MEIFRLNIEQNIILFKRKRHNKIPKNREYQTLRSYTDEKAKKQLMNRLRAGSHVPYGEDFATFRESCKIL
jgi:hypothetical protein